jgi:hypothetical protein
MCVWEREDWEGLVVEGGPIEWSSSPDAATCVWKRLIREGRLWERDVLECEERGGSVLERDD